MPAKTTHTGLPFMKMHGLGNDFVVIDTREDAFCVSPDLARRLADRNFGVGFDQLAIISAGTEGADADLAFLNADGSASATCGNATRCIARFLMDETGAKSLNLRTDRGLLPAEDAGNGLIRVNLGAPLFEWDQIPLAEEVDTLCLPVPGDPVAMSLGNPHCTFVIHDMEATNLQTMGEMMETHPLFPERTNVELAEITDPDVLRVRVWERGTGVTLASGSCASAAAIAAMRLGLTHKTVDVVLDGGQLRIDWADDGVWMTGPTAHVFSGVLTPDFLAGA